MQALTDGDVTNALSLLADTAAAHRNQIEEYEVQPACPDSDEENDS